MKYTIVVATLCLASCATNPTSTYADIDSDADTGYQWNTPGVDCLQETRIDLDPEGHLAMVKIPLGAEVAFSALMPYDSEPRIEVTFKFRFEHNGVVPWNDDTNPYKFRNAHIIACELHPPNRRRS